MFTVPSVCVPVPTYPPTVEMRIKATQGVQKITKAMKMVASAKLREVQDRNAIAKPFTDGAVNFLKQYDGIEESDSAEKKTHLVIVMTGDRGLCGSVNTNVGKGTQRLIAESTNEDIKILCVGKKGADIISRANSDLLVGTFRDIGKVPLNFTQACLVTDAIVNIPFDKATIVYTVFNNAISQTTEMTVIPSPSTIADNPSVIEEYEFDTDNEAMLSVPDLVEFQIASLMHGYLLEVATSTEASRVQAMDNSTNNAGDLIDNLTLVYNKARQAKITGELIEIISGAEAV
eukprot:SAG31_NODE_1112_length_9855_cov_13.754203_11_plen_289_part_00